MKKTAPVVIIVLMMLAFGTAYADLTGKWKCDDGGTYFLRQTGGQLVWYGEQNAKTPAWSNVFKGQIQGKKVTGNWVDVPKGSARSQGNLTLSIEDQGNVLRAVRKTGGFGGSRWTRVGYRRPSAAVKEDCIAFNPKNTRLKQINGRWKIVDGSHWLFDFGSNRKEARQALAVIQNYQLNQSCFVGRPNPSFAYMLTSGRPPQGGMSGEDCVRFNPQTIDLKQINGRWKIVDGSHWLFDFGANKNEAAQTHKIMKKYRFTRSCFVGRPDPSFTYLRR